MIEKEYKCILDKKQYQNIERLFSFQEEFTQINFYYKEKDKNSDTTIRIRVKDNSWYLQVKEPVNTSNGTHTKRELQTIINTIPDVIKADMLNSLCHSKQYRDSYYVGFMITQRKIKKFNNCEIALDANYYFDVVDYELEIEYQEEIEQEILELLGKEKVIQYVNSGGKFSRFMALYDKIVDLS